MPGLTLPELTVLVTDPSATQRKIIARAPHRAGIASTLACSDGRSALEILVREMPDLVISSLYLPDMTGTDLVHSMRDTPGPASVTAFMLISSETRFRYLDPIRQAGAVGILPKPFNDDDLRIALNATLDLIEPDPHLADIETNGLKVLVVDDSRFARNHIIRVLNALGIDHIDAAGDGKEALEMINAGYYDFVVTDYNMPVMDGKELVDHVRHASSQASIPILMVTSEDNENRLAAVQQSGVSAICDKPFEPAMIRRLVEQMVGGDR